MSIKRCVTKSISPFLETIRVERSKIFNLEYHQERLNTTIEENFNQKSDIILKSLITPPTNRLYKCRVIYDRRVQKIDYLPYSIKKFRTFKLINSTIIYRYKSTNRDEINSLFAQKKSCDDIIIVKKDLLQDTSIANIAIFINDIWLTPKTPLFKGVIRAKLLNEKKIFPANLTIEDLKETKKFAIMNAMVGFYEIDNFEFF